MPPARPVTPPPQDGQLKPAQPKTVAPLRSKTPPSWLQCELCARAASAARKLVTVFAREDEVHGAPQPESLMLLCRDCCALVQGEIAEDEWRKRIGPR